MNREPDFDSSADMRLLELQRTSLGIAAPNPVAWETRYAVDSTPGVDIVEQLPEAKSAVLGVTLTATPPGDVIPGTVITYALSLNNEGAADARDVTAAVPLPGGVSYRLGSLQLNGRAADDGSADRLFGAGIELGTIAAGSRATLLWKVGVRMGTKALVVIPQVRARATAVIGGAPLAVERKSSLTAFAGELAAADRAIFELKPLIPVEIPADELPIYELTEEEEIVEEAAQAALSSAVVMAEPEVAAAEPVDDEPELQPQPEPQPVREAVVLYGGLERATLAFFERVFNGSKEPTILQHCIFASALACAVDADGNDDVGLKAHLAAQSQILHRISLHEKLGKKEPIGEYAGNLLATIGAVAPAPVRMAAASTPERLTLANELHEPALAVVRKIAEERERWDFVKARQLTLALQAQRVLLDDGSRAAALDNALRAYAQTSMTVLQKLFVRLRLDRTTGVLFQTDAALDSAARTLLAAANAALPV
ncbi:MAG TPA: hypothetical protein VMA98_05935 [Candidatus Acidoferrales bacterium]|nr:hypothetical protein [Candidatus Acidoferrales bacterium]